MHAQQPLPPGRRGAVAVVVRDAQFLAIRRSALVRAPGALCFPGGAIEHSESETEALVREFREELGATIVPLRRVWSSVTPWQVELCWWLAELSHTAELRPDPAEVASFDWLSAQAMLADGQLLESNRAFLAAVASGEIVL